MDRQIQIPWSDWEITKVIGRGAFGTVYEIQKDIFGKKEFAALKVLTIPESTEEVDDLYNQGYDEQSISAHFKGYLEDIIEEYSIMLDLKGHPNVVYCDDVKYTQHTCGIGWDIFIKMERLKPLYKVTSPGYNEEEVIRLGKDICNALIYCNQQNIIHRDIKPQNIFVSKDGSYKLGDFGVAKVSDKTVSGTKIGTYEYMAPEVYRAQQYGFRVDMYSLGLVMYWMMNQKCTPFLPLPPQIPTSYEKENARNRRFDGEQLPPPVNGSETLKAIVLKACAFDAKDRYASPQDMLNALQNMSFSREEPIPDPVDLDVHKEMTFEHTDHPAGKYLSIQVDARDVHFSVPMDIKDGQTIHLTGKGKYDHSTGITGDLYITIHIKAAPPEPPPINKLIYLAIAAIVVVVAFFLFKLKNVTDDTTLQANANAGAVIETAPGPETVHIHSWQAATCTQAKTCLTCGITEGNAEGHDWLAATTTAPKTCRLCGATEGSPILDIVVGDTITMGYYGNENIEWTVLEFDPSTNQALLFSKYCIDAVPFHTGSDYGSWENSTLRKWLNNEFISKAFNQEERASILTTRISTPDNADYGTDSGGDTSDRVFLLSYEEVTYYFPSKTSRQGKPTDYCWDQGCYDPVKYGEEHGTEVSPEAVGYTWWWLRTAGLDAKHTCNVVSKGTASTYGAYKNSNEGAVRPAMWVQLGNYESDSLSSKENISGIYVTRSSGIELGAYHSVFLREDGTVAATGSNDKSKYKDHGLRCDVSGWTDIASVSASTHTLGLTSKGTVKATGVDRYGQCDVSGWTDIVAISAGDNHSLGVRSDGTVVAAGYNEYGQCDVQQWRDVIQVAAGTETSYGLRSNGTVLSAGSSRGRQTTTNAWSDIISISTGSYFVVGLKSDGTIITAGASEAWADEYSTWTDIVAVCAGSAHIVAVRSDGTVVACGDGSYGQCDVSSWTDIVAVGAGMYHTIGMKRDGTLVGAGHNAYGQLDLINYV